MNRFWERPGLRALGADLRERGHRPAIDAVVDGAYGELSPALSTAAACRLVGKSRATHYRRQGPPLVNRPARRRPTPPNALSDAERGAVLDVLTSPRFVDKSVAYTRATLLDEGVYLASMSTMHRLLRAAGQAGERRRQATHPTRTPPELVARKPSDVWSWDITKLKGPVRGQSYDLYVILDIFSRYVVGWTVAPSESGQLATELIAASIAEHGAPGSLYADRGTSMTSKPVAQLRLDLGIAKSHYRPHLSNDNPYSEAAFKTVKYAPVFPERFGSVADAKAFCQKFFTYYNTEQQTFRARIVHASLNSVRHGE